MIAIVLEVAFLTAAKCTEETRYIPNSFWISFLVCFPVKLILIQLLEEYTIFLILDIMLESTFIAIASAGKIAVLNSSRHPFQYVIIIVM
jgi:hypothetical protein